MCEAGIIACMNQADVYTFAAGMANYKIYGYSGKDLEAANKQYLCSSIY